MTAQSGKNTRFVYSTDDNLCAGCGQSKASCECGAPTKGTGSAIIRIRRDKKGRKGKTVTLVEGAPPGESMKALERQLKRLCATGGSCKDGVIIIQGDHRQKIADFFKNEGHTVRLSGG